MNKAAIAIGSNSTRMLARTSVGELRGREDTRLMLGLNDSGCLTDEAMRRTAQAVLRLKIKAVSFGASEVSLYATSATRDAKNAQAFAEVLQKITGLRLKVISGQEEAALAFKAASGGKKCAVLDIGGGSTELTFGQNGVPDAAASAQMGASRLMKRMSIHSVQDAETALDMARDGLKKAYAAMLPLAKPALLVGIGGTCTTAAAIKRQEESHGESLEGTRLTLDEIRRQLCFLAPMPEEKRAEVRGLYAARAAIIPHGLCILQAVMELFSFDALTVSIHNNLDALVC